MINMKIGTILHTKDGRRIGNAIIKCVRESEHGLGIVYDVETDFGNQLTCVNYEVLELWHDPKENQPPYGDGYERWKKARLGKILGEYHRVECDE